MLGVRYDMKLQMWTVYEKKTGKVIKKYETEPEAKRAFSLLRSDDDKPIRIRRIQ